VFLSPVSQPSDPPLDPLGLCALAIDSSDYATRVAPVIRRFVPDIGDMTDIGAGGGQLGGALVDPGRRWTAIEPAPVMQARLRDPVIEYQNGGAPSWE
jgi:hypothetical protein